MATQLQFSRYAREDRSDASLDGSDASSMAWGVPHRHVAFAVHGAVPSPQLYHQREQPEDRWEGEDDVNYTHRSSAWEKPAYIPVVRNEMPQMVRTPVARRLREPAMPRPKAKQPPVKKTARAASASRVAPMKAAPKPGWDSDARSTTKLFDSTLKKSVLFQPRPGDRLREVKQEEELVRDIAPAKAPARVGVSASSKWNARLAASQPAQPPKRKPKDYVKMNMEKITGQRYETLVTISSPVVSTHLPHEPHSSPRQPRASSARQASSSRPSPTRDRVSTPPSTRRSTPSRASSPGFRPDRGNDHITMAERVFEVLDRHRRGRIGVEQILDGLRLLQLPATHNQVADYVYLIHEGAVDTVDYEEWAILVGTLDAASQSTGACAPSRASSVRSRSSPQAFPHPSPPRSRSSMRTSPPRSLNQVQSPQKPDKYDVHQESHHWVHHDGPVSLSVKMHQSKVARIAKHSDDLAELLLEDVLLDTVEELNRQERSQTSRKRQYLQVETLSSILQQIEHIEAAEAELINSGFALGYNINHPSAVAADVRDVQRPKKAAPSPPPTQSSQTRDHLSLPLGIIMSVDLDGNSKFEEPSDLLPGSPAHQHVQSRDVAAIQLPDERAPGDNKQDRVAASMSCLSGQLFQTIEKNRVRFLKHRQLVESSLESTGMDQASVIEMLADLLLDEIALECAVELENGVEALTDTLAQTLL